MYGFNNNNITIFTIVPVTRKSETNTTDRKIVVVWNHKGRTESGANEVLYGVIKLSPLMKLKIVER